MHSSTRQDRGTKKMPPGLECVEEMLQESRLPRSTFYKYSRSISKRSSVSWITTRNRMVRTKVQRVGWTCKRRSYIQTHSRGKEKIQGAMVSCFEQNRQKWAYEASIWWQSRCHDEKSLTPRIRRTKWRANPSKVGKDAHDEDKKFSPKITCPALELINIQDGNIGLQLQVPRGGTHPNGVGSELTIFSLLGSLFCHSWFRLQLIAIHCNRRRVWTEHPHTRIFSHICSSKGVVARVFVKRPLIHMSSRVWLCIVSPHLELFLSFECLYILSNFFTFSILLIILHVVGTAE